MRKAKSTTVARAGLVLALALAGCGGGDHATAPDPGPSTPAPTPAPTPTPRPTPQPTPSTSCSPAPPPISLMKVTVHLKNSDVYWTLDATPLVGPDGPYCAAVGFTDGRRYCTVRPDGDPLRAECEALAVGNARDTGRPGPTWTREGKYCTGPLSLCVNSPTNQYQLWIFKGGVYRACARGGPCGSVNADKGL
jgi:hypothetical protein